MSGSLRYHVKQQVKAIYDKKVIDLEASGSKDKWADFIYNTLLGPYVADMAKLPTEFFDVTNELHVHKVWCLPSDFGFRGSLGDARLIPHHHYHRTISHPFNGKAVWSAYGISLNEDPVWTDIVAEMKDWHDKVRDMKQQRDKAACAVDEIFNHHTMLAPAIQAWPTLIELIPYTAREQHEAPTTKTKKSPPPSVDTSPLNAVVSELVKQRILK